MKRTIISALAIVLTMSSAFASGSISARSILDTYGQAPIAISNITLMPAKGVRFAQACCKRCSKGKACGDSCISRQKQCQKGPGCACD